MTIYHIQYNKLIQDFKTTNTKNYLKEESWHLRKHANFSNSLCCILCREPPAKYIYVYIVCIIYDQFFSSVVPEHNHLIQSSLHHTLVLCSRHRQCVCAQGRDSGRTSGSHLSTPALIQTWVTRFEGKIRKRVETNDVLQVRDDDTNGIGLKKWRLMYFSTSAQGRSLGRPRYRFAESAVIHPLCLFCEGRIYEKHRRRTKGNTAYRHA